MGAAFIYILLRPMATISIPNLVKFLRFVYNVAPNSNYMYTTNCKNPSIGLVEAPGKRFLILPCVYRQPGLYLSTIFSQLLGPRQVHTCTTRSYSMPPILPPSTRCTPRSHLYGDRTLKARIGWREVEDVAGIEFAGVESCLCA